MFLGKLKEYMYQFFFIDVKGTNKEQILNRE